MARALRVCFRIIGLSELSIGILTTRGIIGKQWLAGPLRA